MIDWNQIRSVQLVQEPNQIHVMKCIFFDESCLLVRLMIDANHHFFREFEITKKIQEALLDTPWTKWKEPLVECHNLAKLPETFIHKVKYLVEYYSYHASDNRWIQTQPFFKGRHYQKNTDSIHLRNITAMGLLKIFILQNRIPGFRHNDLHKNNWLWLKEPIQSFKIDLDQSSEETICVNHRQDPEQQINVYFIDYEFSTCNEHNFGKTDQQTMSKFVLRGISSIPNNSYDVHYFLFSLYAEIKSYTSLFDSNEKEFCEFVERHIHPSLLLSINNEEFVSGLEVKNPKSCYETRLHNVPDKRREVTLDDSALLLNNRLNRLTLTAANGKETLGSFFSKMQEIETGVHVSLPPVNRLMNWVHYDYLPEVEKMSTLTTMLRDPYLCSRYLPCADRPLYVVNSK